MIGMTPPIKEVVHAILHLLNDTEKCLRNSPGSGRTDALLNFLHDFRLKRINPIFKRLQALDLDRYVLSMVGLTNVGKSTLAHALLRHPVAPRRNGPGTSIPVEYEHGDEWVMKICSLETRSVQKERYVSSEALAKALEQRVFDVSVEQASKIERVSVLGPMDLLEGGLVFADTPGFGAAQPEGDQARHQDRLIKYVREHVNEVLFCVSGANCTVKQEEVKFFHDIQELCSAVLVTKWDSDPDVRQLEIQEYKSRYAHLFEMCEFMFIEAKWAIEGQTTGKPGKLVASGVEDLREFICQRASSDRRGAVLRQQVANAWEDLIELEREPLLESCFSAIPWREDGRLRLKGAAFRANLVFRNL